MWQSTRYQVQKQYGAAVKKRLNELGKKDVVEKVKQGYMLMR